MPATNIKYVPLANAVDLVDGIVRIFTSEFGTWKAQGDFLKRHWVNGSHEKLQISLALGLAGGFRFLLFVDLLISGQQESGCPHEYLYTLHHPIIIVTTMQGVRVLFRRTQVARRCCASVTTIRRPSLAASTRMFSAVPNPEIDDIPSMVGDCDFVRDAIKKLTQKDDADVKRPPVTDDELNKRLQQFQVRTTHRISFG